jgi:putative Mg2+ transporter-C (MgtC) family protein
VITLFYDIWVQLEFLLRLVVAGICGCLIGYERKNRLKEAGIRTHIIVALGAALIMIISKYGFVDILKSGVSYDSTRIASQIVSGIGFLGAGMIFVRKQAISGLTTAAGVWTTAGIGMAIGARLYFIGIAATVLVLIVQVLLHRNYRWFHMPTAEQINITFSESTDSISFIQDTFSSNHIRIINLKAEKLGNGYLEVELYVKLPQHFDISTLMNLLKDNPHVKSIEF